MVCESQLAPVSDGGNDACGRARRCVAWPCIGGCGLAVGLGAVRLLLLAGGSAADNDDGREISVMCLSVRGRLNDVDSDWPSGWLMIALMYVTKPGGRSPAQQQQLAQRNASALHAD